MVRKRILNWLRRRGISIVTRNSPAFEAMPPNLEPEFVAAYAKCGPLSMTSADAMYALWRGVEYIVRAKIPGDFVECGVYRGGSTLLAAEAFKFFGDDGRRFYLYDTYEGMTAPTQRDVDFAGRTPQDHLKAWGTGTMSGMANSSLEQVRQNMLSTGRSVDRFVFVQGKVEDTIPGTVPPGAISMLRLDTDWYESTKHELVHLYPRLSPGGVLIIDDYAFWRGAREACDEYFREKGIHILLNRIDRNGPVIGIKPA